MLSGIIGSVLGVITGAPIISGIAGAILLVVFKLIKNDWIKKIIGGFTYGLGVTVTLGLSKWPYTRVIWNKIVEPFFIDLIDNIIIHGAEEFIRALRSDNK